MEKDIEYVNLAIELSKKGAFPYGAVVVKDDVIIGQVSSGEGDIFDPTCHAETLAIRKACKNIQSNDLTGATIYSSCEPCFMCFGTIWWARVSRIVYGMSLEESNKILEPEINITSDIIIKIQELNIKTGNKVEITGGILKEEAMNAIKEWKVKYLKGEK